MNSSCTGLVWSTIIANYIRAENLRERENTLLALNCAQWSALKRADVDEVHFRRLCSLPIKADMARPGSAQPCSALIYFDDQRN